MYVRGLAGSRCYIKIYCSMSNQSAENHRAGYVMEFRYKMRINQSGKSLLCKPWYIAVLVALPVWAALYRLNQSSIDLTWPIQTPATFLLLVLLYPVLEEVVFRGLVQGELMRRAVFRKQFFGITCANILASIVFSSAHLFTHPVGMAALVFLPSLVFGYFRDRHDGWLLPSILLHIYYNLGYFLLFKPAF